MTNAQQTVSPATRSRADKSRGAEVAAQLDLAAAGERAVALTGNVHDVLIGDHGQLQRNPQWLATWADSRDRDLIVVDARGLGQRPGATTLRAVARPQALSVNLPAAPLEELLSNTLTAVMSAGGTNRRRVVIWVDFCCLNLDVDDGPLLRLLTEIPLNPNFTRAGHLLVLGFPTRAPRELGAMPGWSIVDIGLPGLDERTAILDACAKRGPLPVAAGMTAQRLATNLGGMTGDAVLRLLAEARAQRPLDDARVSQLKAREISRLAGSTLTVESQTRSMSELAGLANLRLYLRDCDTAGIAPGVILLAGPPGTGKTRSWLAVADHLGVPAVRLGQLRSRWVGDSENNWSTARQVLEATAPSCVLLDEADQIGLGHRTEDLDSGVSSRLRAELWDFLNSCGDLGITVIATTNNPAGLDPAALDRVAVLPVLHPTSAEALQIMAIEARRAGIELDADVDPSLLTGAHGLLTGRRVVRLLRNAARHAATSGHRGQVRATDLRAAMHDTVDIIDDRAHELMALSALLLTDSRSSWPWEAAARLGEPVELPPYLTGLLTPGGEVDIARMHERITQLRGGRAGW
jgi:AAA+ superfamily predicted ATPase